MAEATKSCPFCDAINPAGYLICRFCWGNLTRDTLTPLTGRAAAAHKLEQLIAEKTRQGYGVVSRTPTSVQLRKPCGMRLRLDLLLTTLLAGMALLAGFSLLLGLVVLISVPLVDLATRPYEYQVISLDSVEEG